MNEDKQIHLFFDMDGVLCRYIPEDYMTNPATGHILFEDPSTHYFRHCEPDSVATQMFNNFRTMLQPQGTPPYHLHILSSIANGITDDAQDVFIEDKGFWLLNELLRTPCADPLHKTYSVQTPVFDYDRDVIFARQPLSKPAAAENTLGRNLTPQDILIDDFNANLEAWRRAGGTSVKYLNGVNSPSEDYPLLNGHMHSVASVRKHLAEIMFQIYNEMQQTNN